MLRSAPSSVGMGSESSQCTSLWGQWCELVQGTWCQLPNGPESNRQLAGGNPFWGWNSFPLIMICMVTSCILGTHITHGRVSGCQNIELNYAKLYARAHELTCQKIYKQVSVAKRQNGFTSTVCAKAPLQQMCSHSARCRLENADVYPGLMICMWHRCMWLCGRIWYRKHLKHI